MLRDRLRQNLASIHEALRQPEDFAIRWHLEGRPYPWSVFAALALTAIVGTTTYGLILGLTGGLGEMLRCGGAFTLAAGIAWGLPLPALYILNSLTGSRLRASTTFLAALVTTSWGGLALLAAIPIAWFFTAALPNAVVLLLVHLAVFTLVGVAMATGICLPTFYFFGLLAGVRISVLQVTTHVLKGKAATAVFLLGLIPIYLAVTLGMLIFHAPAEALTIALDVGLALPFLAGLWGVRSIYAGFLRLADTLPPEIRCRRTCFLRRLTVAWAAIYTVITPVMIWSLYQNLAAHLGGRV